jgi:hypothetical protein
LLSFPRVVGLGEIGLAANGLGYLLMFGKLLAVVESDHVYPIFEALQESDDAACYGLCGLVCQGKARGVAWFAFVQCQPGWQQFPI